MKSEKFSIHPLSRFVGQNFAIRKPQEVTCFSYDEGRKHRYDDSSLRYYYDPPLGVNLSEGFNSFIKYDDSVDEHLNGLLAAMAQLEQNTNTKYSADIITWRGMMTKIMNLPFNMHDGFEMNAVNFQGTIYVEENHDFRMSKRGTSSRQQEVMSYWGYKFETMATLPKSWDDCSREEIETRTGEVVSNHAQFCSVVKTALGDVKLVLGGEVDAIWDQRYGSNNNYVELKTSKEIQNERDEIAFEKKLQRFWSQSFLLGVNTIICGFRDNDGRLLRIQEFDTQGIPSIAKKSKRNLWDGNFSINFTTTFLQWLRMKIVGDCVWRIRYQGNSSNIELFQTDIPNFLSPDFRNWRKIF